MDFSEIKTGCFNASPAKPRKKVSVFLLDVRREFCAAMFFDRFDGAPDQELSGAGGPVRLFDREPPSDPVTVAVASGKHPHRSHHMLPVFRDEMDTFWIVAVPVREFKDLLFSYEYIPSNIKGLFQFR